LTGIDHCFLNRNLLAVLNDSQQQIEAMADKKTVFGETNTASPELSLLAIPGSGIAK
jgi:hypothetical protein